MGWAQLGVEKGGGAGGWVRGLWAVGAWRRRVGRVWLLWGAGWGCGDGGKPDRRWPWLIHYGEQQRARARGPSGGGVGRGARARWWTSSSLLVQGGGSPAAHVAPRRRVTMLLERGGYDQRLRSCAPCGARHAAERYKREYGAATRATNPPRGQYYVCAYAWTALSRERNACDPLPTTSQGSRRTPSRGPWRTQWRRRCSTAAAERS